jgi:hypothetical protein
MKAPFERTILLAFCVLFCAIGGTLLWRYLANSVPAWVVVLLALVTGAFGLIVFARNMQDARAGWNALLSPRNEKSDASDAQRDRDEDQS